MLAHCGGSSTTSTLTPPISEITNYTVGGTISGLSVGSVVLANGTATVTVSAGATTWAFPVSFTPGGSYTVTVQTQPSGELCQVISGASGTNTGNVDNVSVACGFGEWTWDAGLDSIDGSGVYGTQGSAAAANAPGARYAASTWTDSSGNFWLFGGVGYGSTGTAGYLNDLWRYTPGTQQWTWIAGGTGDNAAGVYGTQGTAGASNVPGARYSASSWIDTAGNLWLFGGIGYDAAGSSGYLDDLWRYSPSTGQWTWIGGGSGDNAAGIYGTQGTAAAGNMPGSRYAASSWVDASGNLWLFGGVGYGSTAALGDLNDLWEYSPTAGQWTWVSGGNANNAVGVYGTQDIAASGNAPGARYAASSWLDSSGNLWLFGGYGYDSTGAIGRLNDLWLYTPSAMQWTWVGGEDAANASGVYGALGTAVATNVPGARQGASTWTDSSGNFWMFGGVGYDLTGGLGELNDLWQYSPSTREWTWFSGGTGENVAGVYGTQGTASTGNFPGGRNSASSWVDSSGNLWLFGGDGYDSSGELGYLNDLWQFTVLAGT